MKQQIYNSKSILVSAFLAIILVMILTSCSVRKVNKSNTETKETTKTEISETQKDTSSKKTETNIKIVTETKVDTEKNIITEVIEITPIDATKKATATDVNGKTIDITNAKYRNEKTTDLSKEKKVSISEYNQVKKELEKVLKQRNLDIKIIAELQKKLNSKDIDKEGFNFLSLWWLLLLIPAYFVLRKFIK